MSEMFTYMIQNRKYFSDPLSCSAEEIKALVEQQGIKIMRSRSIARKSQNKPTYFDFRTDVEIEAGRIDSVVQMLKGNTETSTPVSASAE